MTWARTRASSLLGWVPFLGGIIWLARSSDPNLVHVATLITIWSLWGTSFNLIWGYAGQFSMAQVGLGAVSAYTAALAVNDWGWTFWPALAAGITAAVAASVVVGLASLRLSGFYFAIMTLAFALLFLSFVRTTGTLGRSTGLSARFDLGTVDVGGLRWDLDSRDGGYLLFLVLLVSVFLVAVGRLENSRSGRALVALREDPVLAASVGVRPSSYRLLAFTLSALVAGVAGVMYAGYLRFISPDFFGFGTLVVMIVQLVLGGRGHRFGPVLGAAIYIGLTEWARFGGSYREATFGAALVLIVLFAPAGVLGSLGRFARGRNRSSASQPGSVRGQSDGTASPPCLSG